MWSDSKLSSTECPILVAKQNGLTSLPMAASLASGMSPIMPYSGGSLEQPAVPMEAIAIWNSEAEPEPEKK